MNGCGRDTYDSNPLKNLNNNSSNNNNNNSGVKVAIIKCLKRTLLSVIFA